MAEWIEMPFGRLTHVVPTNHVLNSGTRSPQEKAVFRGCPAHSEAMWHSLQNGSFSHQYRHAAECTIQYAGQVDVIF